MSKNFLKDNIRSILAITLVAGALGISYVGLFRDVRANDTLTNQIVTAVWNTVIFVLGYYFGASKLQTDNSTNSKEITITEKEKQL